MACEDSELPKTCCCGCSLRCGGKIITGLGIASCSLLIIGFVISLAGTSSEFIKKEQQLTAALVEITVVIILIIQIIFHCVALHGILKNNIKLITSWLTYAGFMIVVGFMFRVYILACSTDQNDLIAMIRIIFWSIIEFYCWRVMYALYLEMKNKGDIPRVVQTQGREDAENEESFHSSEV